VIARYWSALKDLAQGQKIQLITQSQVHRFLRKGTVESTKATNARWGRWEDILLDPDLIMEAVQPTNPKKTKTNPATDTTYEWILYTDGSKKGRDHTAHWGFLLEQGEEERHRQRGQIEGSAQAGEVTAVLEGLLAYKDSKNSDGQSLLCTSSERGSRDLGRKWI